MIRAFWKDTDQMKEDKYHETKLASLIMEGGYLIVVSTRKQTAFSWMEQSKLWKETGLNYWISILEKLRIINI